MINLIICLFVFYPSLMNLEFNNLSLRLAGMGNLGIIIEDEFSEISFYDFGNNVAGLIEDDTNRTLIRELGIYCKEKLDEWADTYTKEISGEATYRTHNMAFSLKSLQLNHESYIMSYDTMNYISKYPLLSLSCAYKLPYFTIGGEIEEIKTYGKDDATDYKKRYNARKIKTGVILPSLKIVGGELYSGLTFKYCSGWQELYRDTVNIEEKTEGVQIIYFLKDKLKCGITTGISEPPRYGEDDSSDVLKTTEIRSIYTVKNGENKVNIGFEVDFATPFQWESFENIYTYKGQRLVYGGGLFYSRSQKGGIGIEFLMNKSKYKSHNEIHNWRSIRIGGELNVRKYFYLRSGYCAEYIFSKEEGEWFLVFHRAREIYTAGLGLKLLLLKLDITYNFEEGWISYYGRDNIRNHSIGVMGTFYL